MEKTRIILVYKGEMKKYIYINSNVHRFLDIKIVSAKNLYEGRDNVRKV